MPEKNLNNPDANQIKGEFITRILNDLVGLLPKGSRELRQQAAPFSFEEIYAKINEGKLVELIRSSANSLQQVIYLKYLLADPTGKAKPSIGLFSNSIMRRFGYYAIKSYDMRFFYNSDGTMKGSFSTFLDENKGVVSNEISVQLQNEEDKLKPLLTELMQKMCDFQGGTTKVQSDLLWSKNGYNNADGQILIRQIILVSDLLEIANKNNLSETEIIELLESLDANWESQKNH